MSTAAAQLDTYMLPGIVAAAAQLKLRIKSHSSGDHALMAITLSP
jgi:hypothetical protein